ncbi:hypothetical protein UPYG_G00270470 [Umbra pygmaea]|uniref:Uncharacterized protein n=1 Tax=Umbra pygmaea TaxID=75934 RepID=A0ABD0WFN6_UMBPY
MGASLDTPVREPPVCPLCHFVCRDPKALTCKHCFCYRCISELWSASPSGPYYCPECKEEYKTLPRGFDNHTYVRPRRDETPRNTHTAAATGWAGDDIEVVEVNTEGWTKGKTPSISSPSKRLLGKRPASSQVPGDHHPDIKRPATATGGPSRDNAGSGERPGTSSYSFSANPNRSSDVGSSSEEEASAELGTKASNSSISDRGLDLTRENTIELNTSPAARELYTGEPFNKARKSPKPTENINNTSTTVTATDLDPPSQPARESNAPTRRSGETTPTVTPTKEKTVGASEQDPGLSPRTPPVPAQAEGNRSPGCTNRSPSLGGRTNSQTSRQTHLPCHYCPSHAPLPAVKTCLVCGASLCADHLRHHLESPVFRSHTLVLPVEDISPWRCPEHQEMNRIYCRQCSMCVCTVCTVIGAHQKHAFVSIREAEEELRRNLKEEMRNMQESEQSLLRRVTEMTEKKELFQVLLGEARAGVQQKYRVMRDALEKEEATALQCVTQEESRAVGGLMEQLTQLQDNLTLLQQGLYAMEGLADARGATRVQEQAFIMEYNKISKSVSESCSVDELDDPEEVDVARLQFLQKWTDGRLNSVVISLPQRDPFRLLYGTSPCLDPDTAHPRLLLSEGNRMVSYTEVQQAYPEQGARFSSFPQVLARKPLQQGRAYWEVEVLADEGRWKVGLCEGQIGRKGQKDACRIGFNPYSWCLLSDKGNIEALHDKVAVPVEVEGLERVGVLVDIEEGRLSFYKVAQGGALSLLHCFNQRFNQPLFPALAVSKTQLTITDLFQTHSAE